MAKGPRSRPDSSLATRQQLIGAARQLLESKGYAGTTARAIGEQAGCNQALVFYHFGSLHSLLLAALDVSSAERMQRYRDELTAATSIRALLDVTRRLYQEDRRSGHVTVLAQMVAGGLSDPELGEQVSSRIQPWVQLAKDALAQATPGPLRRRLPIDALAYAVVAMSLGLELLGALTGDHTRTDETIEALTGRRSPLRPRRPKPLA